MEKRQWDSPATLFAFEARERAEIPPKVTPAMRFADSHLHLSDYPDPDQLVRLSISCGMVLAAVSVDRASSQKSLEIARKHLGTVKAFVGVHPSEAGKAGDLSWFRAVLHEADGCGEIGLDPKYSEISREGVQGKILEAQLQEVEKAGKPVQVHSRSAENACLQRLSTYTIPVVLMHWFEDENLARVVQDRGYYVSFGPALLYSNKLRRIAASFERKLVLSESDGPVSFSPFGGVEGPALVPSVAFELSRVWKAGFEETRDRLSENSARYFRLTGKG